MRLQLGTAVARLPSHAHDLQANTHKILEVLAAGAPIKVVLRQHLVPEQLQTALSGKTVASLTLDDSQLLQELTHGQLVSALVDCAPQLTALPFMSYRTALGWQIWPACAS